MKRLVVPLLLIVMLASACQPAAPPATTVAPPSARPSIGPPTDTSAPPAPPTATPAQSLNSGAHTAQPPSTTPAAATSLPVALTPAQLAAVQALAGTLKIPADQISLVSTQAMNWPDGCLGVALPGVACAKGLVPGFLITLSAGGRQYEYHTNQDGTSVISTQQGFTSLRVAVRAADDSVQLVDTGFTASQANKVAALLPLGGSVGDNVYALDFKDQPQAQLVDKTGTQLIPFVLKPNYGLAVWPGNGAAAPRLAWATSPSGDASESQLFMAGVDGSNVTPVFTETTAAGQPPHQLVAQRWSADGQALYFSREPYGIGGYIPFSGASSLYRYNLADRSITELVPVPPNGGGMICLDDLSADFILLVGHCADPKTITVHSLIGAPDQSIQPPDGVTDFRLAGGARFSPDATRVAFGLARGDPSGEQGWVAVSDGLGGPSKLVATSDPGHFDTVVAWLNADTLLLQNNTLDCNPTCVNSLWTVSTDGSNLNKLADGTFLTLVGGN